MFRQAKRRVVMVKLHTLSSWLPKYKGFAWRYTRESCYGFRVTSEVTSSIEKYIKITMKREKNEFRKKHRKQTTKNKTNKHPIKQRKINFLFTNTGLAHQIKYLNNEHKLFLIQSEH